MSVNRGDHAKHPDFIIHEHEPFNGGPPPTHLNGAPVTPTDLFFVRNHFPVPTIDPADYRLVVGGLVDNPLRLSLDDLRRDFPRHEITATLQCAGNRRTQFAALAPIPGELLWGDEAISTATWAGVPLRDVLLRADVQADTAHIAFEGLDRNDAGDRTFGGSIPLEKALQADVLLAYEMNGSLLPPLHGYPLRVVVPGYIGARSVKWLGSIMAQTAPSDNYYQAKAYRLFPPGANADNVDWSSGLMLGELPVNSLITAPADGASVTAGEPLTVRGIASGANGIARVDVTTDGGATWVSADLLAGPGGRWTWRFWQATLTLPPGTHEIAARAVDTAANTQPADPATIWNFKGYMNNAWPRLTVTVTG